MWIKWLQVVLTGLGLTLMVFVLVGLLLGVAYGIRQQMRRPRRRREDACAFVEDAERTGQRPSHRSEHAEPSSPPRYLFRIEQGNPINWERTTAAGTLCLPFVPNYLCDEGVKRLARRGITLHVYCN